MLFNEWRGNLGFSSSLVNAGGDGSGEKKPGFGRAGGVQLASTIWGLECAANRQRLLKWEKKKNKRVAIPRMGTEKVDDARGGLHHDRGTRVGKLVGTLPHEEKRQINVER